MYYVRNVGGDANLGLYVTAQIRTQSYKSHKFFFLLISTWISRNYKVIDKYFAIILIILIFIFHFFSLRHLMICITYDKLI